MQVFPELQRNSSYYLFVKLLLIYAVNFLSSFSPFLPVMFSFFIVCEEYFFGLFFIVLFSYFHNFNIWWMFSFFIVMKFYFINFIRDMINFKYQDVVGAFVSYLFLLFYLFIKANLGIFLLIAYIVYNFAFDVIVMRLSKCELISL